MTPLPGQVFVLLPEVGEQGGQKGEGVLSPFSCTYLPFPGEAYLVSHYAERMVVYTDTMGRASQRRGTTKGVHTLEGQQLDEATGGVVTRSYATNIRKRRIDNLGY